jgi:ATP:ADP antiporter, AAA family
VTATGSDGDHAVDRRRVVVSFAYFALLLAAYYLIRPVRDSLVAGLGSEAIKYLSTAVFGLSAAVATVYGALISRVPRRTLVPGLYLVFALKLVGFAALFALLPGNRWVAGGFYLWVAVFNLVMVSTFWSFMADLWGRADGQRVFARIAAGGSLGGVMGPWLARQWATDLGPTGLTAVAAVLLTVGAGLSLYLMGGSDRDGRLRFDEPVGGQALAGLRLVWRDPYLRRLALLLAGGSLLGMWVYIEVAKVAAHLYADSAGRTAYFAERDLWVNVGSLAMQFLVTPWLTRRLGVGGVLVTSALTVAAAFAGLAIWPVAGMLLAVNVLTRTLEFGLAKPSRDVLYTAVDAETQYKAKNVLDTVYARGCDSTFGWLHALLLTGGAGLIAFGGIGCVIALGLAVVGRHLGRDYLARSEH